MGLTDYNYISIEGNIGAGKTSLATRISEDSNARLILEQFEDDAVNLLFVGRVTPNKKHEDVIKAFYAYKRFVNPHSRLLLVGKYNPKEAYFRFLQELIGELRLEDVYFSGHVTQSQVNAYYTMADVFLSMSEHEGFFVPALESAYFRLPVLAYNCTAVPYTLGGAGVLINHKRYAEIAELIQRTVDDEPFRQHLVAKQAARLEHFQKDRIVFTLFQHLGI